MFWLAVGILALLVSLSTFSYFGIMSVLLWKLAVEGTETRRVLGIPLLPALLQNFGIPFAILGFALEATQLVIAAGLMITVGILTTSDRSISLHPDLETPMLLLAIVALFSVGLFRVLI